MVIGLNTIRESMARQATYKRSLRRIWNSSKMRIRRLSASNPRTDGTGQMESQQPRGKSAVTGGKLMKGRREERRRERERKRRAEDEREDWSEAGDPEKAVRRH